jgi:hypothetical protein
MRKATIYYGCHWETMQISRETLSYKKGKRIKASKTETSFKHTYISYKKKKTSASF